MIALLLLLLCRHLQAAQNDAGGESGAPRGAGREGNSGTCTAQAASFTHRKRLSTANLTPGAAYGGMKPIATAGRVRPQGMAAAQKQWKPLVAEQVSVAEMPEAVAANPGGGAANSRAEGHDLNTSSKGAAMQSGGSRQQSLGATPARMSATPSSSALTSNPAASAGSTVWLRSALIDPDHLPV